MSFDFYSEVCSSFGTYCQSIQCIDGNIVTDRYRLLKASEMYQDLISDCNDVEFESPLVVNFTKKDVLAFLAVLLHESDFFEDYKELSAAIQNARIFTQICDFFQVESRIKSILESYLPAEKVLKVMEDYKKRNPHDELGFNKWDEVQYNNDIVMLFEQQRSQDNEDYINYANRYEYLRRQNSSAKFTDSK